MKKNFMTRVLAVAMSAAMALSMATATNLTVAEAASAPAMKNASFTVRVGNAAKTYRATAATRKAYKIVKAAAGNADKATAKIVKSGKAVAITAGTKTGKTVITLTFKNRKTAAKKTVKFSGKVLAAKVAEATIKEVKQTKGTELVVTLSKEVESVKAADFVITRDDDNLKVTVSKAVLDAADKSKVTVTTYLSMVDGKSYTVDFTSAEGKQSSAKFTATDGVVASTAVTPVQITANTATVINYQTIDANGVVIDEKSLGKADNNKITYEYIVTKGNGVLDANTGKATLVNVGDTMDITVTYHTFKWANGVEEGAATSKTTITAVPSTAAVDKFSYTIATTLTRPMNWARLKQNTRVCVDDKNYYLYARILDNNGVDITDTCGYTVESSDTSTLLVTASDIKNAGANGVGINVVAVKVGSAYVLVKDEAGKTVATFPVETGAKRVLSTVALSKSSVVLATKSGVNASQDDKGFNSDFITVTPLDQYNDYMGGATITNFKLTSGKNYSKANLTTNLPDQIKQDSVGISTGIYIRNTNKNLNAGTDYYTFDTIVGTKTLTSSFSVTWSAPTGAATKQIAFTSNKEYASRLWTDNAGDADGMLINTVDTTVTYGTAATDKDQVVYAHFVEKKNSVITTASAITSGSIKSITVRGPQGVIAQSGVAINGVACVKTITCAAVNEDVLEQLFKTSTPEAFYLPIKVVDKHDKAAVAKTLEPGTYTVSAELNDGTYVGSATFTVSDSQATAYASILENSDTAETNIATFLSDPDNALFFYDDVCYTIKGYKTLAGKIVVPESQVVRSNNGRTIYVKNALVTFLLPGSQDVGLKIMVPINQAFTSSGVWS